MNQADVPANPVQYDTSSDAVALVVTTLPEPSVAERVVRRLVEEKMIACGNIFTGLVSIYRWQERVEREGETLVLMKTRKSLVSKLFERVTELHPYEIPELVELDAERVSSAYGQWVMDSTRIGA